MAMPVLPMERVLQRMQRVVAVRVLWAMHRVVVALLMSLSYIGKPPDSQSRPRDWPHTASLV